MRYFSTKGSVYTPKNKLQEAALAYLKTAQIERRIIEDVDLPAFFQKHIEAIDDLNTTFSRCKNKIKASSSKGHSSNDYNFYVSELISYHFYAENENIIERIKILSCPQTCENQSCSEISKAKKTCFIDARELMFETLYHEICREIIRAENPINVFIIDGVEIKSILKEVVFLFLFDTLTVVEEGKVYNIPTPKLIITTNLDCTFLSEEELKICEVLVVDKKEVELDY